MQSNGGLAAAARFHAMASVLSGPAGGLIGMHWVGERLNCPRLIGFDMGGTSTDVSLIDGELPQRFEHQIAGVRLMQPMLDVHTIAAGGGSILAYRDGALRRGTAVRGRRPRTGVLRARRAADAHRRAGAARAAASRTLCRAVFGRERGCRDRRGGGAAWSSPRSPRGWARRRHADARGARRVLPRGRRRGDGERHPPGVDAPGAATPRTSPCSASAAPPASTPAAWRAPRACAASWCTRSPACCRPSGSAWPIASRCGGRAGAAADAAHLEQARSDSRSSRRRRARSSPAGPVPVHVTPAARAARRRQRRRACRCRWARSQQVHERVPR